METVEGLLGTVHVGDPTFAVEQLEPGATSLATGDRWALLAVAHGRVEVLDGPLDAGDVVLLRGRGGVPARVVEPGTTMLVVRFALHGAAQRLVRLPDHVVVPADSELCRLLIERLVGQLGTSDVVSGRLLDWLVTDVVRDVLTGAAPIASVADAGVSEALAAVHADPASSWTVDGLARRSGISRAAFARRFRDAVGTSPLSYVREHRLDLAERALLTEPDTTVAAVARRVGYANPFSFSTAFRRYRGVAPSELRSSSAGPEVAASS
ncbi:helix-turn-helix transcriptional regulator [Actinomycetospora atypica]|uniref:AraC family transcriptional regulator n=1 Tax=Actinomycetospora atypica TaxID=1290095 RepID=A0ABV9YNU4_9PSEU